MWPWEPALGPESSWTACWLGMQVDTKLGRAYAAETCTWEQEHPGGMPVSMHLPSASTPAYPKPRAPVVTVGSDITLCLEEGDFQVWPVLLSLYLRLGRP